MSAATGGDPAPSELPEGVASNPTTAIAPASSTSPTGPSNPSNLSSASGWLLQLGHEQRKTLVMLLLALATGVEFFENIMFVFSASHIVGGVDADPRSFALVQAAYAVGSMLMIMKQQWLSREFGYRRYVAASLLLFSVGTLAAALSHSVTELAVARFIQGVGGGALFTSCRVLVLVLFGPADRPRAARIFMLGIFVASAMGPAMAAALIEHGVWQDVFYGVLPLSLLAMLGAWLLLPDTPPRGNDGVGPAIAPLLLFGAAVVALQAAMSEARFDIFSHPLRLALVGIAGALLLGAFLWQQWHHDTPVLRVRGLRDPVYLTGLGLYFLYYLISNLAGYVFPIYAEQGLGLPLQTTGWLSTFSAGVSVVGIYLYQKTAHRMPRKKPLIALGLVVMAAAALWFSGMPAGAPASALLPGLFAKGMFGVMMIIPVAGLTFSTLEREDFVHGYRGKNLVRQIGGSFASALGAVLMQNRQFALHTRMSDAIGQRPAITEQWLGGAQASLTAQGIDAGHAHLAAMARLASIVEQQATLMACEDLYRLLAAVALCAVVLVVVQKRLR